MIPNFGPNQSSLATSFERKKLLANLWQDWVKAPLCFAICQSEHGLQSGWISAGVIHQVQVLDQRAIASLIPPALIWPTSTMSGFDTDQHQQTERSRS